MKKYLVALCAGVGLCLTACQNVNGGMSVEPEEYYTEVIALTDSVAGTEEGQWHRVHIEIQAPDDVSTELGQNVCFWINQTLATSYSEWGEPYTGDVTDIQAMEQFYRDAFFKSVQQQEDLVMPTSYEAIVELAEQTPEHITYECNTYLNLGGAHPSSGLVGQTFGKVTGKPITVFQDNPEVLDAIKMYIESDYFSEFGNMDDLLFESARDTFPMPQYAPYILDETVKVVYQEDEIAPYAMGMPTCQIGFDIVQDYFTPECVDAVGELFEMESQLSNEEPTPEAVTAKLNVIYDNLEEYPLKYTSKAFQKLIEESDELTPEGELGAIEYDYWLMSQDVQSPKMEVKKVTMDGEDKADAEIAITDMGNTRTQTLKMIRENSEWVVDDFITTYEEQPQSLKAHIQAYIDEVKKQ